MDGIDCRWPQVRGMGVSKSMEQTQSTSDRGTTKQGHQQQPQVVDIPALCVCGMCVCVIGIVDLLVGNLEGTEGQDAGKQGWH